MLVKKFEAPTLEDALSRIKQELGPDALILSTEEKKTNWFGKPSIEVTAEPAPEESTSIPIPREAASRSSIVVTGSMPTP